MDTPLLQQELAPLNAKIEEVRQDRGILENELRVVEAELETLSGERGRFEALREVCDGLDKLGELQASPLFWEGIPGVDIPGHLVRVRDRVARFEGEISGILERQSTLQSQLRQHDDELDLLYEEVREAYDREERRREEFVVEREMSTVAYRPMLMPWSSEADSERRFRRALLAALLLCFFFGALFETVKVPIPDRTAAKIVIPERLAMLVKNEPPRPEPKAKPEPKHEQEETAAQKAESEKPATKPKPKKETPAAEPVQMAEGGGKGGVPTARKVAESTGVLAFKNTFEDLLKETPVARLGTEAPLSKESMRVAGLAMPQRSLVAMQGAGSGGISNFGVSRNIGSGSGTGSGFGVGSGGGGSGGGFGSGVGPGRVQSSIKGHGEATPRPLSDGVAVGRTDEEIQIVFDRYKASLYRIYNTELRKDPTLRGKILLRICIETGGEVSFCKVESTDLASPSLVAQIIERILRFNFGPKEGAPKTTILYPIDFLPAGEQVRVRG